MKIIVSSILIIVGIVILFANKKGWIHGETIQTIANIITILLFVFGIMIGLFISFKPTLNPLPNTPSGDIIDSIPKTKGTNEVTQNSLNKKSEGRKIFYNVKLLLPSYMSDAFIWVDEKRATIIDRTPTVVTIRVDRKEINHRIVVKKENYPPCIEERLIQNDLVITPCQ